MPKQDNQGTASLSKQHGFPAPGLGGFINPKTKKHCMKECNIHFHLKKTCLRVYDQVVEFKEITMMDEVFKQLSDKQMEVLHKEDILQHIIKNKSNA